MLRKFQRKGQHFTIVLNFFLAFENIEFHVMDCDYVELLLVLLSSS